MLRSFYWHDYETFGADPVRDRPCQFAGVRTDLELNIIGDPLILFSRPTDDYVPDPEACLITGITPQKAAQEGLPEAEFIARIDAAFREPGTCVVGYNNLRFDDEVTRHTLYRNLRDPYAREWQGGNSRWDLIDVLRLAHAIRPDGIEWPKKEDGSPSFRLEALTRANGIEHGAAHDAMSDVYATIGMARLLKEVQPRLFDYALQKRDKHSAKAMLDTGAMRPVFHVSSRYPARLGCCALVVPVTAHPENPNAVIVYDLRADPSPLADLDADAIRERIFTRGDDLPDGVERLPLKAVHVNKCPVLAPAAMLKTVPAERMDELELDGDVLRRHLAQLRSLDGVGDRIRAAFTRPAGEETDQDPDEMLYAGGFIPDADRRQLESLLAQPPETLGELNPQFTDSCLEEMFFRYRARNYPQTLNSEEQARWEQFRQRRLMEPGPGWRSLPVYFEKLEELGREGKAPETMLEDLQCYGESLIPYVSVS